VLRRAADQSGAAAEPVNDGILSETCDTGAEAGAARIDTPSTRTFSKDRYLVLRGLVTGSVLAFFQEYTVKAAKLGFLPQDDPDVPDTPCRYGDSMTDALLEALLPQFEEATGKKLDPTYSYFRVYKRGDVLKRHKDRPACEISVTLSLGYSGNEPWPIWIEPDGRAVSVRLEPGDGLLYKGVETAHWRESFCGEYAAQVFLHYVDQEGSFRKYLNDGRPGTAATPVTRQIVNALLHQRVTG
jgi:hypothetical protein